MLPNQFSGFSALALGRTRAFVVSVSFHKEVEVRHWRLKVSA